MLLEWKGLGPLSVHDPRRSGNYKLASAIVCTPGINKLEDGLWHGAKDSTGKEVPGLKENPQIKALVKEGQIVVKREKDVDSATAAKKGEAAELSGLAVDDAKSVVQNTYNMGLLEEWADTETRPKVRRAIDTQIQSLIVKKKDTKE